MDRMTLFVDVLLPVPVPGTFTYRVPFKFNNHIQVGQRASVQFGRRRVLAGIILEIHERIPKDYTPKYVLSILDEAPLVLETQFRFWKWMSGYYMSTLGEVMAAALPSAFRLTSESKLLLHPSFVPDREMLTHTEYLIAESLLQKNKLSQEELSDRLGITKLMPILKTMIERGWLIMEEDLEEVYRPKTEKFVGISIQYSDNDTLQQIMDELNRRAPKQLELLMAFIGLTGMPILPEKRLLQATLLRKANGSASALKALVDKGIFIVVDQVVSRLESNLSASVQHVELSEHQLAVFGQIERQLQERDVILLHGVTGGGKTEIYIKMIEEALSRGEQVLYLLPEIALTTQIIQRLQRYFGDEIGVYHSRFGQSERAELWLNMIGQQPSSPRSVIIGPRSAIFLPFNNLGLVIVDEEHDSSYKQFDPAPRYNARDAAVYLAYLHEAKVILGSATPAIESFYNARQGKYGYAHLTERYGDATLPEIKVVDMKDQQMRRLVRSHFSSVLLESMEEAIKERKQSILFQNRRGFSLRIECEACHWVPECRHCDVTLTYHKKSELLKCHYCGYTTIVPESCPDCGGTSLKMKGFGTEKVEEELNVIFPDVHIDRLDFDTTRTKNAYLKILQRFEQQKTDILTGTQMVTKGLDFDHVQVVGVLSADSMLSYPDFRAHERSFQMMAQVSGRAGRKSTQGKVIIQTWKPKHPVITQVVNHDYEAMYAHQMLERQQFQYPPFYRLIVIRLKHRDSELLNKAANSLGVELRALFKKQVLGPEYPLVGRIRNFYIKQFLLKFPRSEASSVIKERIVEGVNRFRKVVEFRKVVVQYDVDPQ